MILYLPKCSRKSKNHSKFVLASYMGRKSIFFKYLICFYEKIFSHSMGNLFSLLLHSKNSYKYQALCSIQKERNPNLKNKPKILANFHTFLKIRVSISSHSQPQKTIPLHSGDSQESKAYLTRSQDCPEPEL